MEMYIRDSYLLKRGKEYDVRGVQGVRVRCKKVSQRDDGDDDGNGEGDGDGDSDGEGDGDGDGDGDDDGDGAGEGDGDGGGGGDGEGFHLYGDFAADSCCTVELTVHVFLYFNYLLTSYSSSY